MSRPRSMRSYPMPGGVNARSAPRATSPTFSQTTDASQMDLSSVGAIITRKDLRTSMQAYEDLINSCTAYRQALTYIARATSEFANAMHAASRLKGVIDEAGINLQAAGGLHYLMGNHWDILAHTLENQFEEPLRQSFSEYKAAVIERSTAYERTLLEKSKAIKQTEAENLNYGRRKHRDLQSFRQALSTMQAQIDELDRLKVAHYQEVLDHEEEVWEGVAGKVCLVVRSSLDVFDRVTSKASDPVLESMVQSIPDPFDSYGPPKKEGQLFSILTPLAMTPDNESTSDGIAQWVGDLGTEIAFPQTEPYPTEFEGSSGRIRRHSAPMASSSSSNVTTSVPTLPPTPTRRPPFPAILSVIDENRGKTDGQPSEDTQRRGVDKLVNGSGTAEQHDTTDEESKSLSPTSTLRLRSLPRPEAALDSIVTPDT
ncbi:hypothetical protein M422DRAFT_217972 [Sphaerobolus stellatus SS14]|nr:hypothetical protein M422DRAFT_217972 [Sphaerobolus stellatus SS14]